MCPIHSHWSVRKVARARGRAKRIDTVRWQATNVNGLALGAGSQALTMLAAGAPSETIMRTRGNGVVFVDGATAPGKLVLVSMGLVLVPEGQGTTVIWDPLNDDNAPWFWWSEQIIGYEEKVTDVIADQGLSVARFEVDSKAMRKANVDEEVQFVVTNTTIDAAVSINISVAFRLLMGH